MWTTSEKPLRASFCCPDADAIMGRFHELASVRFEAHPALLSLSAMISQYFTNPTPLILIHNRLRRRFAQFKLCAHLLDLRRLLVQTRSKLRNRVELK